MAETVEPHIQEHSSAYWSECAGHGALGLAAFSVSYFCGMLLFVGDQPQHNGFAILEGLLHRPATHSEVLEYIMITSISIGAFAAVTPTIILTLHTLVRCIKKSRPA